MTENVETKTEQPKVEAQQVTAQTVPPPAQDTPEFIKSESNKENWKKFKEQREVERKQFAEVQRLRDEEAARAEAYKAALDALVNKPQHAPTVSGDIDMEEERIQRKIDEAITKRDAKLREEEKKRAATELPQRIARECPGFDQVCTTDNIDYLEFHHPEISNAIKYMPEGFDRWNTIYQNIKRHVPSVDLKKDNKRLDQNLSKPQSISAPSTLQGTTPQGAHVLSEERRAANWERMQKQLKGLT